MILEIPNSDMDAIAFACANNDGLNYKFFPTEFTGIVKVRVTDRGKEISPAVAYRLCAVVEQKKRYDSERLLERELMPEGKNDVLIVVENL